MAHLGKKVYSRELWCLMPFSTIPYVIKFVCDLRSVSGFLRVLWFHPTIKTDSHDIIEIFGIVENGIKHHNSLL
jgi:hypothetical protein